MKVLKFGGTSVGKPERMNQVKDLITMDNEPKIVVLSAVSGTTNTLVAIGEKLYKKDTAGAEAIINDLYPQYVAFNNELYSDESYKKLGQESVDKQFAIIRAMVNKPFSIVEDRILLAQGELMSTQMFTFYAKQEGLDAELIWALDFMSIDEFDEPELELIEEKLKKTLASAPKATIYVTQGFICKNHKGEVDNLKRGGSDYTASLVGAAIDATEVQIWTDIDGMHNNDPRIVENTKPISHISFDEAAELAYFGAKILHPATIIPAARKKTPVKLLNTMEPTAKGTIISDKTEYGTIKAVAAKDNITAIKIKSGRMLMAYGFLRKIFEVFEKYRTPIDMITTSEVAVSLTIDNDTYLDKIITELEILGQVEIDTDQTIICIAGQGIAEVKGPGMLVFASLNDIPVRMVSYGGSKNNISLLIKSEYKVTALQTLNKSLFNL